MGKHAYITVLLLVAACSQGPKTVTLHRTYEELPLGAIKPAGWLEEMLIRQRNGITATLDETYPQVLGDSNGWLGGDGDRWERGPYWVDGLLPLAYILEDDALKQKAQRWVDWALESQQENGFFGPDKGYPYIEGLQRGLPLDWWPRIVVLKILKQYYNATEDERVRVFFDKYFRYQLATLPETPIDKWSYWARFRAGDNLDIVLWFYNLTKAPYLLKLADLLHEQSFDFTGEFLGGELLSTPGSIHCVNLAQGMKEPLIYWQYRQEQQYLDAVNKALDDIRTHDGYANGMFGGDEALHGADPVQGSELCSAVELMYSYEQMLKVSGDPRFADNLERVAFNALPAQTTSDFRFHQYYQQANQVSVSLGMHNFDVAQEGTGLVFGFLTAYPCCLTNQHQGWPKFTQNLWYRTSDGGLAAMVYSPCSVRAELGGTQVSIAEETSYPFDGRICLKLGCLLPVAFPLELRIPSWSTSVTLTINGEQLSPGDGPVCRIEREWHDGDTVCLEFGMQVSSSRWYANSTAIERGPLVYALGLPERWKHVTFSGDLARQHGEGCWEVTTAADWNYALHKDQAVHHPESLKAVVDSSKLSSRMPWTLETAPIHITVNASHIDDWKMYNGDTGPIPYTPSGDYGVNGWPNYTARDTVQLRLVPYGCTKLRISQFPSILR